MIWWPAFGSVNRVRVLRDGEALGAQVRDAVRAKAAPAAAATEVAGTWKAAGPRGARASGFLSDLHGKPQELQQPDGMKLVSEDVERGRRWSTIAALVRGSVKFVWHRPRGRWQSSGKSSVRHGKATSETDPETGGERVSKLQRVTALAPRRRGHSWVGQRVHRLAVPAAVKGRGGPDE
jgi:hypothetical protein